MRARRPIVAGQFYPDSKKSCEFEVEQCLKERQLPELLPQTIAAGIVPHAGWTFSGSLAALVFSAIKQQNKEVDTFIIFGAAHGYFGPSAAVYGKGSWLTPLGEVAVDEELAAAVLENPATKSQPDEHETEHSIEVQVPFIQYFFKDSKILPILVPPSNQVVQLGTAVGEVISNNKDKRIVCIGSTDLTHYGPRYGFIPMGYGPEALKWAREINDERFINLALNLEPQQLLESATESGNACGPGAAAATVAAAKKLGKIKGTLLAQTDSNEVMLTKMGTSSQDSVGYAAIVF